MASRYIIEPHESLGLIYGLHSGDGAVRYVGKTTRLKARMTEHLIHSRDGKVVNRELADWINSIDVMYVTILENMIPVSKLDERERAHISAIGMDKLFNLTTNAARVETRVYAGHKRGRHIFNADQIAEIRLRVSRGETRVSIARELGVHRDTICQIAKGETYR